MFFSHRQIRDGRINSNQILHIKSKCRGSDISETVSKLVQGFLRGWGAKFGPSHWFASNTTWRVHIWMIVQIRKQKIILWLNTSIFVRSIVKVPVSSTSFHRSNKSQFTFLFCSLLLYKMWLLLPPGKKVMQLFEFVCLSVSASSLKKSWLDFHKTVGNSSHAGRWNNPLDSGCKKNLDPDHNRRVFMDGSQHHCALLVFNRWRHCGGLISLTAL